MATGCHGEQCRGRSLKRIRYSIGIEERNFFEQFRVPAGQSGLAGTVCSRNEGQCGTSHREGDADFFWRSARISCKRFFSTATPVRAAWAIFCAISIKFKAMAQEYSNPPLARKLW